MAFGTVPNGTDNRIWVGTTPPTATVLLGGLQQWEFGGEAETQEEEFYNGFTSIITVGEYKYDGTGSGKWADADDGLIIVQGASETQDIIAFAVAPNGTDGKGAPVRVSRFRLTGGGVRQAAGYQFSVVQADDPFDVGGGLT